MIDEDYLIATEEVEHLAVTLLERSNSKLEIGKLPNGKFSSTYYISHPDYIGIWASYTVGNNYISILGQYIILQDSVMSARINKNLLVEAIQFAIHYDKSRYLI